MKLVLGFFLFLPLLCIHGDPRAVSGDASDEDNSVIKGQIAIAEEELLQNSLHDNDITVREDEAQAKFTPSLTSVQRFRRHRQFGKRRGKGKNKKKGRKGKGRRKGRRWNVRRARQQRRRRPILLGATTGWPPPMLRPGVARPLRPSLIRFAIQQTDCGPMRYRGITKAILKCADTDVDTFMDFVTLTVGNSSLIESLAEYPVDEQKQLEEILSCLGRRKRWHKARNLTEVLDELRQKEAFMNISPCIMKIGRNCSWEEEEPSDWLLCMEKQCQEVHPLSVSIKSPELTAESPSIISCDVAAGSPNVTVTWWSGAQQFYNHLEEYSEDGTLVSNLRITPSRQDDGRVIICRADKAGNIVQDYWVLSVNFSPEVTLESCPSNITFEDIESRRNITLRCLVKSNPLPDRITWWHNEYILTEDTHNGVTLNQNDQTLNVELSEESVGSYTCQATNKMGETESEECVLEIGKIEMDNYYSVPVLYEGEEGESSFDYIYPQVNNPFVDNE